MCPEAVTGVGRVASMSESHLDGWIRAVDAAPPPGSVMEVGVELVVWTTESGTTCVAESRCPHQWSPLAQEGVVVGEELLCTAHGWRFDVEGRGTKLNALGRRDRKADVEVVPHHIASDGSVWARRSEETA